MNANDINQAYNILSSYTGNNPYICVMSRAYKEKGKILNEFETKYIVANYNYQAKDVNRLVKITPELAQRFVEKYGFTLQPKKVLVTRVIGEIGRSYHCYVKYRQSEPEKLVFASKRGFIEPLFIVNPDDIKIDFSKYDAITAHLEPKRELRQHQKDGITFMVANKRCINADSMGAGKMQSVDTHTPTPSGWVRMGNLRVGSEVYGSDGLVHHVTGVFRHHDKSLFKVKFADGTSTNCGMDHLWLVRDAKDDGEPVVKSLEEIVTAGIALKTLENGEIIPRFFVPMCRPVEMEYKEFTMSTKKRGYACRLVGRIPQYMKKGTIEQRKELVAAIFGAESYEACSDTIKVFTKDRLVHDLREVVGSLGDTLKVHESGITAGCRLVRSCKGPEGENRLDYSSSKAIVSVDYWKNGDAVCIKVDSDDSTYLTEDYIVTHNTTQAIVASMETQAKNVLVITTASLKTTWRMECELYLNPGDIQIINGSEWKSGTRYTIVNYDIVQKFYEVAEEPVYEEHVVYDRDGKVAEVMKSIVMVKDKSGNMVPKMKKSSKKDDIERALKNSPLFQAHFDCVIIDEAQKLSNRKSIRYKTISDFLRKSNPTYIFLLTGTPLTNRPMNLYNILSLIDAEICNDYNYFITRFCGAEEHTKRDGSKFITFGTPQNLDELRDRIKHIYIRRLPEEIGDMVKKTVERRYYDLDTAQRAEYNKLWEQYLESQDGKDVEIDEKYSEYFDEYDGIDEKEKYRTLIEGGLVRQFLGREMVKHTIELANEFIEDDEKVVIITVYKKEMNLLKDYYGDKCVTYHGGMTVKQKDKAQESFMKDPNVKVFIGQVIACGVGLNLQVSSKLIFNNYDWVSANNRQAESRIHRLTQTKDVECIYQLFTDSISQEMFEKVIYKGYLMDTVIKSEEEK